MGNPNKIILIYQHQPLTRRAILWQSPSLVLHAFKLKSSFLAVLILLSGMNISHANPDSLGDPTQPASTRRRAWNIAANIAGHIIPVTPLLRSLSNKDKRFYMLVETPAVGLLTDPVGMIIFNKLTGTVFSFSDLVQNYFAYQGSQIVRNGVTLEKNLSDRKKVFMNWWITVLFYGAFNGIPQIMHAIHTNDPQAMSFALSTVSFAALWPIITQNINTRFVVPMLFDSFPNRSLLNKIYDVEKYSREEIIHELEDEMHAIEDKAQGRELTGAEARSIKHIKKKIEYVNWFRLEKKDGTSFGMKAKQRLFWLKKTAVAFLVATVMISAYHSTRLYVRGSAPDPTQWGPLTELVHKVGSYFSEDAGVKLSPNELDDFSKAVISQVKDQGPAPELPISSLPPLHETPPKAVLNEIRSNYIKSCLKHLQ